MKAILNTVGIDVDNQVDFANNGKEMFEKIKQAYNNDLSYKIVFTDFSMPIMDGIQASFMIRKHLENHFKIKREN